VDKIPCHSHRLRGLEPITKVETPTKRLHICDEEFEGSYFWFDNASLVEVEVVNEIPPPKFNPRLIELGSPLLIQVRDIFGEPFHYLVILLPSLDLVLCPI
jgi:hypothetical protein